MKGNNIGWLSGYFRGKNVEDEPRVNELFCDDNRKEDLKELLSVQFAELMTSKDKPAKNLDHILHKIHYNINLSTGNSSSAACTHGLTVILRWSYRAAAIIILPILLFWGVRGYLDHRHFTSAVAEIHAPGWSRTSFTLPDGSTGWLNSKSVLRYKVDFNNDRKVELEGEAFFDVKSDSRKPFVVDAGDISVKVHGTRFNVSSWTDEDKIEVVLEEGKIELMQDDSDSTWFLKPNELAIIDRAGKNIITETVEPNKYLSWTEGKLVFRNDPLAVVEKRLERWYNVDVDVSGSFAQDFRLRATFVDESLEEVLEILKKSLKVDYAIEHQGLIGDSTYGRKKVRIMIKNN